MKRLLSLLILTLLVSGCSGFLDKTPISHANVQDYYKTKKQFEGAITGAYSTLTSRGVYDDDIQMVGDLRADNSEMGTTASTRVYYKNMSQFELKTTNPITSAIWNDHYKGIVRANKILGSIDKSDAPKSFRERTKGEAEFLRALFYFNLVRVFGDVPLVTKPLETVSSAYSVGRTKKSKVYNKIIEDLKDASQLLPQSVSSKDEGRATKGAALALLGKVYITQHDFKSAKSVLKEVIDSNQYQLLSDYNDLWKVSNKNNKEIIFAVQFKKSASANTGSDFCIRYRPYLYPYLGFYSTSGGYNIPTENVVKAYEPSDLRQDVSVQTSYKDPDSSKVTGLSGRFTNKYHDKPIQNEGCSDNWPVIRYADVLLMYAEALNEIGYDPNGPAFHYLNMVRERAGLPDKTAGNSNPDLAVNSQDEFSKAILHERRVEFAFEGHRWFDLVRTGQAIKVLSSNKNIDITKDQLLLPIPQDQVDINPEKIKQNPGY